MLEVYQFQVTSIMQFHVLISCYQLHELLFQMTYEGWKVMATFTLYVSF